MNVYPFIAAERARQSNVPWACALPTVSRAAYYAWSAGTPSARRLADEELLEQICMAHKASRGTYGSPRITGELRSRGVRVGAQASRPPDGPLLRLFRRHLQAVGAPDALYMFGVHRPAGHLREAGGTLAGVAIEGARQADHGRRQGVLLVAYLHLVTLGGAVLAEGLVGTTFGDHEPLAERRLS